MFGSLEAGTAAQTGVEGNTHADAEPFPDLVAVRDLREEITRTLVAVISERDTSANTDRGI